MRRISHLYTTSTIEEFARYTDKTVLFPLPDNPLKLDREPREIVNPYSGSIEQVPLILRFEVEGMEVPEQIGVESLVQIAYPRTEYDIQAEIKKVETRGDTLRERVSIVGIAGLTEDIGGKIKYIQEIDGYIKILR